MKLSNITVDVTTAGLLTGDEYDVIGVPGTEEQLSKLGTVALGEVWTVSRYRDESCGLIRYMPPYKGFSRFEKALESSITKCVIVADRNEYHALAISLCDYSRLSVDKRQFFEDIFEGLNNAVANVRCLKKVILIAQNADVQISLRNHIETHSEAAHHV
ncbi:hypothetical protein QO259_01070 [Salinicola sp. JS01]|uniref:hypothetical protein n=1 Tax=Salinicola sp. JS01 TaxID=3050071 RepID=UPI00255C0364|nr:hypothetical protein [Salinicola sp. JS01]WIX33279.1 hypothetical protein QO259_01070 [Salinicola sp. JS01]